MSGMICNLCVGKLSTVTPQTTFLALTLIPHMLETFMARDRGFRRGGGTKPAGK